MEFLENARSPDKATQTVGEIMRHNRFVFGIMDEVRANVSNVANTLVETEESNRYDKNKLLEEVESELSKDQDLAHLFNEIILKKNMDVLRKKTEKQMRALQESYINNGGSLEKVSIFKRWLQDMKIVRADAKAEQFETFKSPKQTGNIQSFEAPDCLVQADNYVYASFKDFPHYLTEQNAGHLAEIEMDNDWNNRTEIAMMDILEIYLVRKERGETIKSYLNNLFDFEGGKDILALYFATIFDSPEEAKAFIAGCTSLNLLRKWRKISENGPISLQEIESIFKSVTSDNFVELFGEKNLLRKWSYFSVEEAHEKFKEANDHFNKGGISPERIVKILKRMLNIEKQTGLKPPLASEVRIRDFANIRKSVT